MKICEWWYHKINLHVQCTLVDGHEGLHEARFGRRLIRWTAAVASLD